MLKPSAESLPAYVSYSASLIIIKDCKTGGLRKYEFHYWFTFLGQPAWTTEEVDVAAGALGEGVVCIPYLSLSIPSSKSSLVFVEECVDVLQSTYTLSIPSLPSLLISLIGNNKY
ncbi:hypothetical protein BDQ17DRAFT_1434060 [Cyathus striatus]|nr:hypothetical protein BDQ17DRAFT_1434060 [Cyathus striatus]